MALAAPGASQGWRLHLVLKAPTPYNPKPLNPELYIPLKLQTPRPEAPAPQRSGGASSSSLLHWMQSTFADQDRTLHSMGGGRIWGIFALIVPKSILYSIQDPLLGIRAPATALSGDFLFGCGKWCLQPGSNHERPLYDSWGEKD